MLQLVITYHCTVLSAAGVARLQGRDVAAVLQRRLPRAHRREDPVAQRQQERGEVDESCGNAPHHTTPTHSSQPPAATTSNNNKQSGNSDVTIKIAVIEI